MQRLSRKTLIGITLAGVASATMALGVQAATQNYPAAGLKSIDINNFSGNIQISPATDNQVKIITKKGIFHKDCKIKMDKTSDRVSIKVIAPSGAVSSRPKMKNVWVFGGSNNNITVGRNNNVGSSSPQCEVHFSVTAPKTLALKLDNGAGDITVSNMAGMLRFRTGSGDVTIKNVANTITGSTGSGDVIINGHRKNAIINSGSGSISIIHADASEQTYLKAASGAGNVFLTYDMAPKRGKIAVDTGAGDITVKLPASTQVNTNLDTGAGDITNQFQRNNNAPLTVKLETGAGDARLLKGQ